MCALNRISIGGFRRLASVRDVELRPLTVLIGVNGVGKSSFLDTFSLLAASASGQLNQKLSDLGGLGSVLTRGLAKELSIDVEMSTGHPLPDLSAEVAQVLGIEPEPVLKYHFGLDSVGSAYRIGEETLEQLFSKDTQQPLMHIDSHPGDICYFDAATQAILRPNWDYNPLETSLSQVPKTYRQPEAMRKRLASLAYYAALTFDASPKSPVRLPQQMRPARLPGTTGENLVSCLYYLREADRNRFEVIEDTLGAAFPGFERLNFPPVAAGTLAMTWKDRSFPQPLFMHELSEGTIRFLWLITLLQSPGLTDITLIDEAEVSLHPDLIRLLVDLLREASQRTQLIVATQSELLIRFLSPKEVLVCDCEDGLTTLTWADTFDLEKWLDDYSLDELWHLGRIGGRR
jgi:predicted ATPase